MKKIIFALLMLLMVSCDDQPNACIASEDFIKQDLQNPATAEFSILDCTSEINSDGSYTVLRKVTAQNSFGVKKEYVYKLMLKHNGGDWTEKSNWTLLDMLSEEYRP
jgi:hypothetical protein